MFRLLSAQALALLMLPKTDALNLAEMKDVSVCGKLTNLAQIQQKQMSEEDLEWARSARKAFSKLDKDDNGEISIKDFCQLLHNTGAELPKGVIKSLIEQGDFNQNKRVSLNELEGMHQNYVDNYQEDSDGEDESDDESPVAPETGDQIPETATTGAQETAPTE